MASLSGMNKAMMVTVMVCWNKLSNRAGAGQPIVFVVFGIWEEVDYFSQRASDDRVCQVCRYLWPEDSDTTKTAATSA